MLRGFDDSLAIRVDEEECTDIVRVWLGICSSRSFFINVTNPKETSEMCYSTAFVESGTSRTTLSPLRTLSSALFAPGRPWLIGF